MLCEIIFESRVLHPVTRHYLSNLISIHIGIVDSSKSSEYITNRWIIKLMKIDTATLVGKLKEIVVSCEYDIFVCFGIRCDIQIACSRVT